MAAFTHCIACGWFLLACKGLENGSHSCQADSWAEVGNRGLGMLKAVWITLLKRRPRRLYDNGLFPRMVYISNYLGPVQVLYFTCAEFNATIEKNLVFSFIYIRLGKM